MMVVVIFFFKQKTAYEVRISDWSSDVCSSDLKPEDGVQGKVERIFKDGDRLLMEMSWTPEGVKTFSEKGFKYFSIEYHPNYQNKETKQLHGPVLQGVAMVPRPFIKNMQPSAGPGRLLLSEGRSFFVPAYLNLPQGDPIDRKSVVEGKSVSVRVDLGCRRIIKKKKTRRIKTKQSKQ